MSEYEVLEVSNGTTAGTVSFLAKSAGFILDKWNPNETQPKDGGVYKDSKLADGRYPAMIRWGNVVETFTFKVTGNFYASMRKLKVLLNEGQNYWMTTFAHDPVWIKVKGDCEGYPRYGLIVGWGVSGENNPFESPVSGNVKPLMDNFTVMIERKPFWSNEQPGTATAILTGTTQTYDGRTVGNVDSAGAADPTSDEEVFFVNHHTIAQLTDVYQDDGGVWSANLMDAALPFNLLPAVPVVNDAVYFVIDTAVGDSGPFSSLVLDIGTPAANITAEWQFYDNITGWTAFPAWYMADNTDGLTNTGVNALYWDHDSQWVARALNLDGGPAITGWAIRFIVTALPGGGPVGGTQQNRDPYVINWPHIEFQSDQIDGDVPALLKGIIQNESNYDDNQNYQKFWNIFTAGLRSVDRGADFSAYLPLADTQWPTGSTTAVEGGGITTFANNVQYSPRGRVLNYAPVGALVEQPIWSITLDNTVANQYQGRFQVFIRFFNGSVDEYSWQLRINAGYANQWRSDIISVTPLVDVQALYMGSLSFPPANVAKQENVEEIVIKLWGWAEVGGLLAVNFVDVVLLPVDEWLGTFYREYASGGGSLDGAHYLEADSVTAPKSQLYTPNKLTATDYLVSVWNHINVDAFQTNTNQRMKIWILGQDYRAGGGRTFAPPFSGGRLQLSKAQRYFSAIGDSL